MSSLFHKLKEAASGSSSTACSTSSCKKKDTGSELEVSLLVKILQNSGSKLRKDGSDKFFGMENFGNTCYCNSIVQALYHSVPFRENLINYPPLSVTNPSSGSIKSVPSIRAPAHHSVATGTSTKQKNLTTYDTIKKRAAINSGQTPSIIAQRPEDKPDSPEYKKRQALMTGPVLELTYENSSLYGMEESTYTGLKDIFMALIESKSQTGVLSPQRFLEIFKIENEMFRTSMHQDAHEFYGLVLNSIIANVEAKAKEIQASALVSIPASHQSAEPVSPATDALFPGEDSRSSGSGWVHEIFEGTLTSETKCLTCETVSQRDETFLDLSIDLDEHSSVTACLRKFSAEEMLCERNKFHCDNCGGLQEAERRTKIKRLPKILALHLKRFKYTEDMTQLQKLFHRVVYPYHLRMFNTTDDAEDPDRLYELYAVVVHIGGNAYHGHYVSVIKTQDRGWLLFDDEMVEPVDKHYARNFFGDKSGMACAYVLFYQETSAEAVRKEQELEGSYVPCHETEKMDPDLGCSVHCLSTSKSTGSSTPTQESRDGLLTDDFISVSNPSINDAPPSLTSSPTILNKLNTLSAFNQCTDGKNKKYLEKKEVRESERAQKAYNKAMAKERKFREKDSKKSSLAKKVPFFHIEDNKLDHREPSQSSVTESERNESTGITQSSSSTGRKYFTFLGGSKNGDERQLLMTSGRKLADKNETEGDEEYYSLDKYSKLAKDRFSFIPLGRKKSRLLRS